MEDTVVFLARKVLNSDNLSSFSYKQEMRKSLLQETTNGNKHLKNKKKTLNQIHI